MTQSDDDDDDDDDDTGGVEGGSDEEMDEEVDGSEDNDEDEKVKKKSKPSKAVNEEPEVDSEDENEGDAEEDVGDAEEVVGEEDVEEEEDCAKKKKVEMKTIKRWKESLKTHNMKTMKNVMHAYHAAVVKTSNEESKEEAEKEEGLRYSVEGGAVFNNLITMCLQFAVPTLEKYLDYTKSKAKKSKKNPLPSSSKQWKKVKQTVKQYLLDNLQLLRQLTDPTMLSVMLRHTQNLCPYYSCFPKITKAAIKRLTRMWSTGEEHVRVLAFLCIRKIAILNPTLFEFILKKLYLSFVKNCKFVTPKSKPGVSFMQNSLVEIFALDTAITYQHAFLYIRQLAIHLRNAITVKKKDAFQAVYNWQYICCLQLWARVVAELFCDVLQPLIYPVVQITLGVIRLIPSARWYPLRFHCVRMLNLISEKTGVYIPTASYLVEVIESTEFRKKPTSTQKPPDFSTLLKASKTQLHTKGMQDHVVDQIFELLLEHFVIYSNSIGFPELIFPITHRLQRTIKTSKVAKLNKDMKQLKEKLQERADEISRRRDAVTFCPKDFDLVKNWEDEQKKNPNTLKNFYETWMKMQRVASTAKHEEGDSEQEDDDEEDEEPKKKKKKKNNPKKSGPLVKDTTQTNNESKKEGKLKKKGKKSKQNNEDDILEDFKFSDDEE